MTRLAALLWLLVVAVAGGYLGLRVHDGLSFRTDLLALLPREEQDPVLQRANEAVSRALGRRVVALVGHPDRAQARAAAQRLADDLAATGLIDTRGEGVDAERLKRLGALYFPHRHGLLSDADRALLAAGQGEAVATRALSQVFGFVGMADAGLLRADPFLLLQSFFTSLPFPMSRLAPDEGMLSLTQDGTTWVLVAGTLTREPFELAVQDRVVGALDAATAALTAQYPGLQVKRLGAVFFAHAGSRTAIGESSLIGGLSMAGTVLLILLVFRRAGPLLHNVLALGVGIGAGLAGSLALFGELHVAALLFGTSLIGVAVDYSLHYSAGLFDPAMADPRARLRHVLPGITLGLATTLIGYATLALAPFPGLRQIAVFSVLGLIAAYLTVVLWLPRLDRGRPLAHGRTLLRLSARLWRFWEAPGLRGVRAALLLAAAMAGTAGLWRLHADDDVRRLQALSPTLVAEQQEIQRLIGATTAQQFVLVQAADDEAALRRQEQAADILTRLKAEGALAGFQAPASFVPSAARQRENRALRRDALETPHLAAHRAQLGLPDEPPAKDDPAAVLTLDILTLDRAVAAGVPLLADLVLAPGLHAIALQGLTDPAAVRAALAGVEGVRLVDPTADFSALLAQYRHRALWLVALSALLMVPALALRYGLWGGLRTMLPPLAAVVLAPAVVGLAGQPFTFFHAMALVLVLAVGMDYAVFCAEGDAAHRPVTLLAVWLATLTTLLSFGLLAFSGVAAVHGFGLTMLAGIALAFFFSPLAARGRVQKVAAGAA